MKNLFTLLFVFGFLAGGTAVRAGDEAQLMVAAKINYALAISSRCEALLTGFEAKLKVAYGRAKSNLFSPMGITEPVMQDAEELPELATPPLVAKFDKRDPVQQKQFCEQHLAYFVEAAQTVKSPPSRR